MAHENINQRREMVARILSGGIKIGPGEAKCLAMVYNCSASAIQADVKIAGKEGSEKTSFLPTERRNDSRTGWVAVRGAGTGDRAGACPL